MTAEREAVLGVLEQALGTVGFPVRLRLVRTRRTVLSLRWNGKEANLGLHERLLDEHDLCGELPAWVADGGRGRFPAIRAGVRRLGELLREEEGSTARVDLPAWKPLGSGLDLVRTLARIHRQWFPHLPEPAIAWGRGVAPGRALRHIRFGCYRTRPAPLVTIHPRLNQPWVAEAFVDHVVFHELCHHAQACRPVRGETAHSPRFREWERRYPFHELARTWERAYLRHLLDGTAPT